MTPQRTENRERRSNTVSLDQVRSQLAILWFIGAVFISLILIAQSVLGHYENVQDVWSWWLPNFMPTLSLILTVLGANALEPEEDKVEVRKTFYKIAYNLSLGYFGVILLTIIGQPFTQLDPLELLKLSNLWLSPFQGLVTSSMGVMFFSKQAKKK